MAGAALTCGAFPWEAEEVFEMCAMFRGYGFAESHAHAFAQHSYASAYMRHHYPAAYFAAFLTEAPGMWPPGTIAQECRRRGVTLTSVCINRSGLSYRAETLRTIRVPLTAVEGVSEAKAREIVHERLTGGKFRSLEDAYDRLDLSRDLFETLVLAGALESVEPSRRKGLFRLTALVNARKAGTRALLTLDTESPELSGMSEAEELALDLQTKGLSETGRHPLDAHRARLRIWGARRSVG
ncbi:hypothetical protein ACFSC4_25930 [Deinococcus malanensis]|uniref:helix-hairpin-helix domain-containing protein n=1 Tax=Deinococcus malanensis TaxID=1706855 RepID=UPI003640CDB0